MVGRSPAAHTKMSMVCGMTKKIGGYDDHCCGNIKEKVEIMMLGRERPLLLLNVKMVFFRSREMREN
jgi:hypothetical protein